MDIYGYCETILIAGFYNGRYKPFYSNMETCFYTVIIFG